MYDWADYCEGDIDKNIPYKEQIHSEKNYYCGLKMITIHQENMDTNYRYTLINFVGI